MFSAALYAFLCTVGFAILFNIPKKNIIQSGVVGAVGWVTYISAQSVLASVVFAAFAGAFAVGITGEVFARIYKEPGTLFVVPGIIPLVPGYGLYYAMLQSVEKNYDAAIQSGLETFLVAIAIASAVISTTSIGRMLKRSLLQKKGPIKR
jgi:uncharacterized membrane protein YjjB (DUF3815 family)